MTVPGLAGIASRGNDMNRIFFPLQRLVRSLEAIVASGALAIMLVVILLNVGLRFTVGRSLVFTEEIAYLCFGYCIFFGVSLLFRERAMIAVDFIVDALPQRLRRLALILNYLILIGVCGYFCYLSAELAVTGWVRRTAFLDIPYFWVNLAPTISFGLMTLYSMYFLSLLARGWEVRSADLEQQM